LTEKGGYICKHTQGQTRYIWVHFVGLHYINGCVNFQSANRKIENEQLFVCKMQAENFNLS